MTEPSDREQLLSNAQTRSEYEALQERQARIRGGLVEREWTVEIDSAAMEPLPSEDVSLAVLVELEERPSAIAPVLSVDSTTGVVSARFQVMAPAAFGAAMVGLIAFGSACDAAGLATHVDRLVVEAGAVTAPP
jgi:hypothetical protein